MRTGIILDARKRTNHEGRVVAHGIVEITVETGGIGRHERGLGVQTANNIRRGDVVVQHIAREEEVRIGKIEGPPCRGRTTVSDSHLTRFATNGGIARCTVGIKDRVRLQDVVHRRDSGEGSTGTNRNNVDDQGVTGIVAKMRGQRNVVGHVEAHAVRCGNAHVDITASGEVVLGQIDFATGHTRTVVREDLDGHIVEVGSGITVVTFPTPGPAKLVDSQLYLNLVTSGGHQISHVVEETLVIRTTVIDEVTITPTLVGDNHGTVTGGVVDISRADTEGIEDTRSIKGQILMTVA